MFDFQSFGLPPELTQALRGLRFTEPTPIQAQAIPPALEGRDILGTAQTGTGKTAAFGIPLATHLLRNPNSCALVLTPTRELAVQVLDQLKLFLGFKTHVKSALLIGGAPMGKQFSQLNAKPRLIVGTPGRINDHLTRKSLNLSQADFLVLDETDRMLDMGFGVQLEQILKFLPSQRQTLMFSATLPPNILKISEKYLENPQRIAVGSTVEAAPKIKQEIFHVADDEKYEKLLELLAERDGSIIIFVKTKHGADRLTDKLNRAGNSADAIHGNLRQKQRDRVIKSFREQDHRIMVATDIAARGLDIPHIEHVINYDMPQNPEDYIHRIGRTARAGAEGEAVCLISPSDRSKWNAIRKLMNPNEKLDRERGESKPASAKSGKKKSWQDRKRHKAAKQRREGSDDYYGDNDMRREKPVHKEKSVRWRHRDERPDDKKGKKFGKKSGAGGKWRQRSERAEKHERQDNKKFGKKPGSGGKFHKGKPFKGKPKHTSKNRRFER